MYSPVISDYLADTISRNIFVIRREIIIIGARSQLNVSSTSGEKYLNKGDR